MILAIKGWFCCVCLIILKTKIGAIPDNIMLGAKKIKMKVKITIIIQLLFIFFFFSCSQSVTLLKSDIFEFWEAVDLCKIDDDVSNGELIKIRAIYSGVEEYWSLQGEGNCDKNVYLNYGALHRFSQFNSIWKSFNKIHENYSEYSAIVDVIGFYQTEGEYGHVESCDSQILAVAIRIVEIKKH